MSETTKKRTRTPSKRFAGVYQYDVQDGRRWGATVELDRDWRTGRRTIKRRQGFRTQDEARDWRVAEQDKRRRGDTLEPSMLPFGIYVDEWLAGRVNVRASSVRSYTERLKLITDRAGHVPLSRLSTALFDRVYRELQDAGYEPSTIRSVHATVMQALRQAVRHRLIQTNPAELATLPDLRETTHVLWSADQIDAFLDALAGEPYWGLVFQFMLETHVRIGEMAALQWDAVDLAAGVARIERGITRDRTGQRVSSAPKTAKGRRPIMLSSELVADLQQLRDRQRFAGGSDLVFPAQRTGTWLQQPSIAEALIRICNRAGVPAVTPHGLRHLGGSLLDAANVPITVISERLGHSSPSITHNVYMHTNAAQHRAAADEMGRILRRRNTVATHEGMERQK